MFRQRRAEMHVLCDDMQLSQASLDSKPCCTYRYVRPEYLDVAAVPELGRSRRGEPQEEQGEEETSLHGRDDAVARFSGQ